MTNQTGTDGTTPGAAPDELPEPIEVNREIPCEIYGMRYGRLAGSPTPRAYLTLTFDAVLYARLGGLLGANLKGQVRIHVVDIQAPLPDDEDDLDEEDGADERQIRLNVGIGETSHVVDGAGQAYRAHAFAPSTADPLKCALCTAGKAHEVHAGQKQQSRRSAIQKRDDLLLPHPYKAREDRAVCTYCDRTEDDEIHDPAKRVSDINVVAFPNGAASNGATQPDEASTYFDAVHWHLDHDCQGDPVRAHELAWDGVVAGRVQTRTDEDAASYEEILRLKAEELENAPPIPEEELTDEMREARASLANRSKV